MDGYVLGNIMQVCERGRAEPHSLLDQLSHPPHQATTAKGEMAGKNIGIKKLERFLKILLKYYFPT